MMKNLLFLCLMFWSSLSYCQTIPWPSTKVDTSYAGLAKDNLNLKIQINDLKERTDNHYARLSEQLSYASYYLGLSGFFFTVLGIGISVYITRLSNKVKKAEKEIRRFRDVAKEAENKSVELFEAINNNIAKVYRDLKRSEIDYLLDKLQAEPYQIKYFYSTLASYQFENADYEKVKKAYILYLKTELNQNAIDEYLILLSLRFGYQAFDDIEINERLFKSYYSFWNKISHSEFEIIIEKMIVGVVRHTDDSFKMSYVDHILTSRKEFKEKTINLFFKTLNSVDSAIQIYRELAKLQPPTERTIDYLMQMEGFYGAAYLMTKNLDTAALKKQTLYDIQNYYN